MSRSIFEICTKGNTVRNFRSPTTKYRVTSTVYSKSINEEAKVAETFQKTA
jgi:hypothetical protein